MVKDQMKRVLLTDPVEYPGTLEPLDGLAVTETAVNSTEAAILEKVRECDAMIVWRAKITKRIINDATNLKIIAERGVGVDGIDVSAATEKGVYVTNIPGVNTISVAEHALGLMLALSKNIVWADAFVKSGKWVDEKIPEVPFELRGKTLGLVGLGKIGSELSKIASTLGMKVVAYDPYVTGDYASKLGVELVNLMTLLKSSDVVSLHLPATDETKGLIGEKEFLLMKKSAILINTSRSEVMVKEALYRALERKQITAAALDVFWKEPIGSSEPLLSLSNILLTPHIAGMPARPRAAFEAAKEVARVLRGESPLHPVNKVAP